MAGERFHPLTQERAREVLTYNPGTGVFTWNFTRSKGRAGEPAGCVNNLGYVNISIDGRRYSAHRLAFLWMNGEFPKSDVDHINHIRNDNRWENLRVASESQNGANRSMRKDNSSGKKGVSWDARTNRWKAAIEVNGKYMNLGRFNELDKAAVAYSEAAKKYFGEFSHVGSCVGGKVDG